MADYTLDHDEVVLLTENRYGTELVLTNRRLVLVETHVEKVPWRPGKEVKSKKVETFLLSEVKTFNGHAQASVVDKTRVEVQFHKGPETFRFTEKKVAKKWVEHIDLLATGREVELATYGGATNALPGTEYVAGALKGTVDTFKGRFGAKPSAPVRVTQRCDQCGAPIEGFTGLSVTCAYCGRGQTLGATTPAAPPAEVAEPPRPTAKSEPVAPPPQYPPSWASDPHGRHELRYWDGTTWTSHVSNGGVTSVDPA